MGLIVVVVGVVFAALILAGGAKAKDKGMRGLALATAAVVVVLSFLLGSIRHIGADEVGVVIKNLGTKSLKGGAYIATGGEQGVQADVLAPGWHLGFWPGIYDVREVPLTEVPSGQVGIIEAKDGLPMTDGQVIAPEFPAGQFLQMLDARYFLTTGQGQRGTQASVLTPGKYRLNTELFKVKMVPQTEILQGEVAVLKANFGKAPTVTVRGPAGALEPGKDGEAVPDEARLRLAGPGEMGVRAEVLPPGKYAINTDAYTVVELWTTQMIAHYTAAHSSSKGVMEEQEITVRTSDGFTFPVDVRVEYVVEPQNAPVVVAKLGDDEQERFKNALNSAVRAIFRNSGESVRALDYVQQRSHQETQSLQLLATQMARFGITVTAVRIGNIGNEQTLGALLKTQTDKEIAKQEQLTFQEQKKAAEQQKELNKTKQESEEERRLATAAYQAKIAEETKKQKVTEATAEAEAIAIRAKAQAEAFRLIADQVGKSNAAALEMLKLVGEKGIQITPRVMVGGSGTDAAGGALAGTILDTMISRDEAAQAGAPAPAAAKPVSDRK